MPGTCCGTLADCTTPAPGSPGKDCQEVLATLHLSCSQQSSSPACPAHTAGVRARKRTWIPGRERQSKGENAELLAQGKAKHLKEWRAAPQPTPARSPAGFKASPSPAARRKILSSSRSKRWLCEEAAKASKALRKERDFNRAFHLRCS